MSLLDAINAAAASLQSEQKSEPKAAPKAAKAAPKSAAKPKAEKPIDLSSMQVKYDIPADFKTAIRLYMEDAAKKDAKVAAKMKASGKSIDGCCEYIYGVMMRRAAKKITERKNTGVGITGSPDEVYGLAMHYYDESAETLKAELKK